MANNPVVHFEIGCRDADATTAFYRTVFGWSFSDYGPNSYKIDTGAGTGVNGHLTALGHEPHNYVAVYIETDDIAASVEAVERAGGDTVVGPLPTGDGREFAWIKDPAGNTIGLIGKSKS
ncbi:MAG: VOC family protein [Parvularculaceae bacterium]